MADYRIPGRVCVTESPWDENDGTQALRCTPPPGVICASSPWYPTQMLLQCEIPPPVDVSFIFYSCLDPQRGITEAAYKEAAKNLGVEVAAIKAVAQVETGRSAFDDEGRPAILFERHWFHKFTHHQFDKKHPTVSGKRGGYTKSKEYTRLKEAFDLDETAALKSASWGRFQIMGFNYSGAGFMTVQDFVYAMTQSESKHLLAFSNFVKSNKALRNALEKKEWAKFAAGYNGKAYKDNQYDTRLQSAYTKFAKEEAAEAVPVKKP